MAKKGGEGNSGGCCTGVRKKRWQKRGDTKRGRRKEVTKKRWQKRVGKMAKKINPKNGGQKRGGKKEVAKKK